MQHYVDVVAMYQYSTLVKSLPKLLRRTFYAQCVSCPDIL